MENRNPNFRKELWEDLELARGIWDATKTVKTLIKKYGNEEAIVRLDHLYKSLLEKIKKLEKSDNYGERVYYNGMLSIYVKANLRYYFTREEEDEESGRDTLGRNL